MERLLLDTSVLVDSERGGRAVDSLVNSDDDVAIAAISAAEMLVGVQLAGPRQRARRLSDVAITLRDIPIEDYDLEVARAHAVLIADARKTGRSRGAHDLIIAATALARQRVVVTFDTTGFAELPGVTFRAPS